MGVLACDRKDCENIMCDHYSAEHGYICWQCLDELKEKVAFDGTADVYKFMATAKSTKDSVSTCDDLDSVFQDISKF